MMLKNWLKKFLSAQDVHRLRKFFFDLKVAGSISSLDRLARLYKTDKTNGHFYTAHYDFHFKKFRYKRIKLLEIGVGGDEFPRAGGESLRMWKKYFPFAEIFAIDIYDKSFHEERRIKIFKGSQADAAFLEKVTNEINGLDIIIDDGSHINEDVIETFKLLFPKLNDGGIYVVEDTQTSYWKDFGGDSDNLNNPKTIMNFFKGFTDSLNNKEFIRPGYVQTFFDKKIISIHFYHNLIFIYKGNNNEESNVILNNQTFRFNPSVHNQSKPY